VDINSGAVTRFDLNPNFAYTNFPNLANQSNALAQPTSIVFGLSGANYFVAAFGSDRVAIVDSNTGNIIARIEINPDAPGSVANPRTKRGPRGLALKPGVALYVANRISNTLSVVDPVARVVIREVPMGSHDPTPVAIRQGRGFLYDAKLSGGGLVSCASCHIDAEMDLLAWDLGDPNGTMTTNRTIASPVPPFPTLLATNEPVHPMKGPMTTQTLRGLNGLDPLHWRGDRTNFLHFNGAFASLLGGTVLSAADMIAYRDFINTIAFQANPNQNLDRTYPTNFAGGNAVAGRNTFFNEQYQPTLQLSCTACHTGPPGPGSDKMIFDRAALNETQDFKVPQLRNIYQKLNVNFSPSAQSVGGFAIVHDGTDPSLLAFLSRPVFGSFATDTTRKANLNAFVQCFDTGTAPAVGYTRTITSNNVSSVAISNDWSMLEAQASVPTNCDLVVKGMVEGVRRGFVYQPASNNYRPDRQLLAPLTRADLAAKVLSGGAITIMGVPPGLGVRLGIDRNLDGMLDGDTPPPSLRIAANAAVAWPTNASGFVLETSTILPGTNWTPETTVRGVVGGEFTITNTSVQTNRFYRLKEL
jgi:YVTN family beta-propeller protein